RVGKYVDAERIGRAEHAKAAGLAGKADQHQWRVERDGGEGICRKAPRNLTFRNCRDDRDAGHECAKGLAEIVGVEVAHEAVSALTALPKVSARSPATWPD